MLNHPWDQTFVGWIHLTSASVVVGGLLFWRFALLPSGGDLRAAISRFRPWFWAAALLLLLTGTYTSWIRHEQHYPMWYFHVLTVKVVLYVALFGVAGALTKPREQPSGPQRSATLLGICLALGLLILFTSAFMRRVRPEPPPQPAPTAAVMPYS